MRWLAAMSSRRIVNVNVNILTAGIAAMFLTVIPVHFSHYFTQNHFVIVGVTVVADLFFDVTIYYILHWLANHWPHRRGNPVNPPGAISFFKDATLVQFERAMLSPLLYICFIGAQLWLLKHGVEREWSVILGLGAGMLITRILHSIWMLRDARNLQPTYPRRSMPGTP